MQDVRIRLGKLSTPEPNSGCSLWTGKLDTDGYGIINIGGQQKKAHRVSWETANGPIPDDLCVCHKCDTPSCIETSHLFLGTRKDNNQDSKAKGRNARGERNGLSKLLPQHIADIKKRRADGVKLADIAAEFCVTYQAIQAVLSGKTWSHVQAPAAERFTCTILGAPRVKGRPRFTVINGRAVAFTPKDTRAYEKLVASQLEASVEEQGWHAGDGPYKVTMRIYRKRRVGDADNFCKGILDAANGILWSDDRVVKELHLYLDDDKKNPRVELQVEAL